MWLFIGQRGGSYTSVRMTLLGPGQWSWGLAVFLGNMMTDSEWIFLSSLSPAASLQPPLLIAVTWPCPKLNSQRVTASRSQWSPLSSQNISKFCFQSLMICTLSSDKLYNLFFPECLLLPPGASAPLPLFILRIFPLLSPSALLFTVCSSSSVQFRAPFS